MRILVVSQYFWPENFRVNDLVKEWVLRGHEVTVLTGLPNYPSGKVNEDFSANPGAFSRYEGARIVRVPMLPRGRGAARLMLNYLSFVVGASIWAPFRLRGMHADVVFVFGASPVTVGLPAVLLARIKRAPVVYWTLDLWPETLAALGVIRSPRLLAGVGRIVKFIYDRCVLVLGQSHGFLDSMAQHCADRRKIRYFPSWAEELFGQVTAAPAPEVSERKDAFNIVFTGNIGEAQDMEAVIAAAARLKAHENIRWIIVGDGRKSEWLRAEVKQLGLEERVVLPGRFPLERMPSFLAHADALLVSLKQDPVFSLTIPGKVQSYLTAGLPIIGMLDGEGAAVIKMAEAGVTCRAGDSEGLAQAVLALAALPPAERQAMGERGRRYGRNEFGRSQLMDRLEGLLHEAVAEHTRGTKREGR